MPFFLLFTMLLFFIVQVLYLLSGLLQCDWRSDLMADISKSLLDADFAKSGMSPLHDQDQDEDEEGVGPEVAQEKPGLSTPMKYALVSTPNMPSIH